MTPIERAARLDAATIMAIANTPLFAAAQMRDRKSIQLFAKSTSVNALLDRFLKESRKTPKTQAEEAFVYLCAVAIFLQGNSSSFSKVQNFDNHRWLQPIIEFLCSVVPNSNQTLTQSASRQIDHVLSSKISSLPATEVKSQ